MTSENREVPGPVAEANAAYRALADRMSLLEYMGPTAAAAEAHNVVAGLDAFAHQYRALLSRLDRDALAAIRAKAVHTSALYAAMAA